jgi:hypothetical protein
MGAKTGYADAILRVLGLRPGQGAAHYLWCEPDPGVRLLLEAYRDPDLAREAASIIRGWVDEEPRALWERLRAEGPPRGVNPGDVGVPPREVARWVWTYGRSFNGTGTAYRPEESSKGTPVWNAHPPEHFADAMGDLPALPALRATITPDARRVDPREVARWAWVNRRAWKGDPEHGYMDAWAAKPVADPARQGHRWTPEQPAPLFDVLPVMPATITPDARGIEPGPDLPPGTVAYMDPPYVGTSGYGHDLPRADVVALARRWAAAGATVAISEAEPVDDLTADGWSAVNITGQRVGQARTFSRQQAEWLTLSRPPAWTPSEQCGLFG